MNQVIQTIIESGVMDKWSRQNQMSLTLRREMGFNEVEVSTRGTVGDIGKLSITHFLPIIAGTALGTFCFLLELIVFNGYNRRQMILQSIYDFLHFILTPDRSWFKRRSAFNSQ